MKKNKIKVLSIDPWLEKKYQFICQGKTDGWDNYKREMG